MSAYAFSEPGDRIAEFADGRGESRASSYGVLAAIKLVSPDDDMSIYNSIASFRRYLVVFWGNYQPSFESGRECTPV